MLNQYRGFKRLGIFLAAIVLMASVFAGGIAGHALTRTGRGEAGAATGTPSSASPRPSGSGEKEENDETENMPGAPLNLSIDGYEIYAAAGSRDTLDNLREGRQAKVLIHIKGAGMRTKDVGKINIPVTKLNDSFKMSGNPKVKATSEREDDLEFTVTFARLIYLGRGNGLKFRTGFKKAGTSSEIQEVVILECEESYPGEHGDSGSTNGQPVIKARRINPQAPVGPGNHFTLELDMESTSNDADIEDMVATVGPGGSVFIGDNTNSRIVNRLDSRKTVSVKLNMIAGTGISGPIQVVDLELKYNYYSGGNLVSSTSPQKVPIPVKGGSVSGQPVIRVGRSIGRTVSPGEVLQVLLTFQNTSVDKDIRNPAAIFESNDQISLLEETDTRRLGELRVGQPMEVPVRLQIGAELSSAASQLLGMTLKSNYDSDKGAVQGTYSEKIVILVNGQAKGPGDPTPNVIVTNYMYREKVTAGQVFDLEMEFQNTSNAPAVENVVMSLDTREGTSINSSSNTFYIPKLGPGESRKEKATVQALFQSKLQSPKITIAYKYEYVDKRKWKQSNSNETIAIPVYQPDRFQAKEPSLTEATRQGEEAVISIPYVNKGRGQVYNVEARLEGEIDALSRGLTLGNFEPGKSGAIDFVVTPGTKGEFEGRVIVIYEDEAMEVETLQIPVNFTVQEATLEMSELLVDAGTDQDRGGAGPGIWFMVLMPAIVAPAIVVRVRRKRRKKKEAASGLDPQDELEDMSRDGTDQEGQSRR